MTSNSMAGHRGHLTPEEDLKLRQAWIHILRLCSGSRSSDDVSGSDSGVSMGEDQDTGLADTKTPDKTREFRQQCSDEMKSPETFRALLWQSIKNDHPDSMVLRFLRARKWDDQKAVAMLVSALDWRRQMDIEERIVRRGESVSLADSPTKEENDFVAQYRSGKSYVRGADREDRPVYIIKVKLHDPSAQSTDTMEAYVLHNIESIRLLVSEPHDKACLIFDLTGFGLRNMDFHLVKFIVSVFEARYPETLGVVLIHNAPFIFWGIWSVIKGWLDPVIASKINFTRGNSDLRRFIPKERLQKSYGGDDPWEYTYVEPTAAENERMGPGHHDRRAELLQQRERLAREFDRVTARWAAVDPGSEAAGDVGNSRAQTVDQLYSNYWELDPYVRSRSYFDRMGAMGSSQDKLDAAT